MRPAEARSSSDSINTIPPTSSPAYASRNPVTRAFDVFASSVTRIAGSPIAFGLALITIVVWAVTGPVFHFSDAWQLVINTGTTIITFLMVFLIQQSQNKDSVAMHLKLNELLASHRAANNQLIGIEDASEDDLRRLAAAYLRLASRVGAHGRESVDVDACVEKTTAEKARNEGNNEAKSEAKTEVKESERA
ncbi:low affinity Fe/Cu permease [Paraburkholderia sp. GV068]|uniref:low affinity iron permease family protein n=1 Tax=unclassified Paraburkholderia TaxID=2615204 RepID=UPI000D302332|nr:MULTISPECIES: low affinity iron permease family protein [unclassified Paraburkholderia]PTQ97179.1 low affinity Fe/Cu permease [Paraburkholderia sp. GV072]PUB02717.1 low affinity Fe/Cu permease [Paraburkholderia sp. GV068]